MKILRLVDEHEGISEARTKQIWDMFEKSGGYLFNKSHAVAYTAISYQCMYMKTHNPAAFFAAALTILGEDKHRAIVKDAQTYGIRVLPPDINKSTDRIEIGELPDGSQVLYAPFSAVKGCSSNGCQAIMRARDKVGGFFESMEQFEMAVEKRACNSRVRDALKKVGAFASIEPGSLPALAEERRKDQAALMGSLIIDAVKIERLFEMNPRKQAEINILMENLRSELSLGEELITPHVGLKPKLMVILDNANGNDGKNGVFMQDGYDDFKNKLYANADLRLGDLYVTGVHKKVKEKGKEVPYTKDETNVFIDYIRREIDIANPTYVLVCGSAAAALFNDKTKPSDLVGRKEYIADKDITVFYAFNPNILYFRPEEGEKLEHILEEVREAMK